MATKEHTTCAKRMIVQETKCKQQKVILCKQLICTKRSSLMIELFGIFLRTLRVKDVSKHMLLNACHQFHQVPTCTTPKGKH